MGPFSDSDAGTEPWGWFRGWRLQGWGEHRLPGDAPLGVTPQRLVQPPQHPTRPDGMGSPRPDGSLQADDDGGGEAPDIPVQRNEVVEAGHTGGFLLLQASGAIAVAVQHAPAVSTEREQLAALPGQDRGKVGQLHPDGVEEFDRRPDLAGELGRDGVKDRARQKLAYDADGLEAVGNHAASDPSAAMRWSAMAEAR